MSDAPMTNRAFRVGLLKGFGIGFVIYAMAMGSAILLAWVKVKKKSEFVQRGWNLVPVLVATRDISAQTELTETLVTAREFPDQFVTASVLKPDALPSLSGMKTIGPIMAGDMILRSHFYFSAESDAMVLFATKDLAFGAKVEEQNVSALPISRDILTNSWVLAGDRPHAVGREVGVAIRSGDPLMWTHLAPRLAKEQK
jgi:Flp pilus assembly protein CpaB